MRIASQRETAALTFEATSMFTFFGLFADPVSDLPDQISRAWPSLNVIKIGQPISAVAVRFGADTYVPNDEDIPDRVSQAVEGLSQRFPEARFLLLRTECFGGTCGNWGRITQDGATLVEAEGKGALRRLIKHWGVDLGPKEIFAPL